MITTTYIRTMALYNRWQNRSLYAAADASGEEERRRDRGAFFKSIHGTLNHLLWGDQLWMHRFADTPSPRPRAASIAQSVAMFESWDDLKRERAAFDEVIIGWSERLDPSWLEGDLTWFSGASGQTRTKPRWLLVVHMFNHQTHHRGQVHAMLTAAGAKPEPTDLSLIP